MSDGAFGAAQSAELRELRRRAYGPGADIFDDPVALARLEELEQATTRTAVVVAVADAGSSPPESEAVPAIGLIAETPSELEDPVPATDLAAVETHAPSEALPAEAGGADRGSATETPQDQQTAEGAPASPRRAALRRVVSRATGTRRRRVVFGVAALAAAALAGGAVGWATAQPKVDRVLAPTSERRAIDTENEQYLTDVYGIRGKLRGHERIGGLRVWTAESEAGSPCLVVTSNGVPDYVLGVGCAPAPLLASVDIQIFPGMVDTGLGLRDQSVIRFVRAGDDVRVTIGAVPPVLSVQ
ncbi:hypothetical protein [Microbacterium candidum]|uniref:Uncharacterized protein n=1 Tax=Microbacterium candidum TaxID=3041922 RepID=A0ABT7MZZ8_9MICO|nr:hypothetical protein [Microbacterium sp. ASV49]MDL9980034.1 hypothetical protein [Microbacterium sp. ASV49]